MEQIKKALYRFHRGNMNRRQVMQGLALTAMAAALPETAAAAGFKANWVNHYTYVAPDRKKTSEWYHEVFGMQIGHQDAKQVHMWYGDKGGDTLMIIRQANAGEQAPRIERFAFTVDNWDRQQMQAELKRRGLQAKSDDRGFWVSDPDGNEIGIFAKNYMKRHNAPASKPALWKTLSANHMVVLSANFKKLRDWYVDLLTLRVTVDNDRNTYCWFGDSVWIPTAVRQGEKTSAMLKSLDHVAYTIESFNKEAVEAELKRRNLNPRLDTDLSFNCVDINGYKTQVCDKQLVPVAEKRIN